MNHQCQFLTRSSRRLSAGAIALAFVFQLLAPVKTFAHDISRVGLVVPKWSPTNSAGGTITPKFYTAPAGNGTLMAASFGPFKPKVRFYWDSTYFYEESDGMPDRALAPNLMVGITSWQQHFPLFTSYFASTTNPENSAASLGFGQPNVWKLQLVMPTIKFGASARSGIPSDSS